MAETNPDELSRLIISRETLQEALNKYAKKGAAGDAVRRFLNDFRIVFTALQTPNTGLSPAIYHDGPYSFVLTKRNPPVPICVISFKKPEKDVLGVVQIQGVKGQQSELKSFRWERMMLKLLYDWTKTCGCQEVRSIKGEKHTYCTTVEKRKTFYLRYDVTAIREGFKYDPALECYRKILDTA